ncbi:MAG: hypothetical protein M4579_001079 [Chaenotheca gracillima]|nr:MAG: hypothetical protein M4579_001079 [Chaenotheca gracillima]
MAWPPSATDAQFPTQSDPSPSSEKSQTRQRAFFEDLPTAYSSITSRTPIAVFSKHNSPSTESDGTTRKYVLSPIRDAYESSSIQDPQSPSPAGLKDRSPAPAAASAPDTPTGANLSVPGDRNRHSLTAWKDKVTNVFTRKAETKQDALPRSMTDAKELQQSIEPSGENGARSPTYLKPFNRISQTSQSAPEFTSYNPYREPQGLKSQEPDTKTMFQSHGNLESIHSGVSFQQQSSDLSSVLQHEYNSQGGGLSLPPSTYHLRNDSEDTYDSSAEDDLEQDNEGSFTTQTDHSIRFSGLSTFDFQLSSDQAAHAIAERDHNGSRGDDQHRHPAKFGNGPPNSPLPPNPPPFAHPKFLESRDFSGTLSPSTSYGDTRNLLNLTQPLPRSATDGKSQTSLDKYNPYQLANPNSGAYGSCADWSTIYEEDLEADPLPLFSPKLDKEPNSPFSNSHDNTKPRQSDSHIEPQANSQSSLRVPQHGLEDDISRELRRISRMSGISTLSGSVVVVNENGFQTLERLSGHGTELDPGHGGFQSSSSRDLVGSHGDDSRHDSAQSDSDLESPEHATQAAPTWKGGQRTLATDPSGSDLERFGDEFADEEEDCDWETVGESGAISRFNTGQDLTRAVSGSSLANFSSFASLYPEEHRASFDIYGDVLQHPGDPRYDFAYRLRQITPGQAPMLLPTYKYAEGSRFPNRNALTPPMPAWNSKNPYRHPSPLSNDHTHPFKSSPPPIKSEISPSDRQAPNFLVEEEYAEQHSPAHFISAQDFAATSNNSTPLNQSSARDDVVQDSLTSSAWASLHPDNSRSNKDEQGLSSRDGSFAKIANLGPKVNITGTPEGTGMREVGSSLANESSPAAKWSSSPSRFNSSPMTPLEPLPVSRSPIATPAAALLSRHPLSPQQQMSPDLDDHIGQHRDLLRTRGLLTQTGFPPPPPPKPRILEFPPRTSMSSQVSPKFLDVHISKPLPISPPSTDYASRHVRSPTFRAPEPHNFGGIEREARLHQRFREDSSIAIFTRERKRNISRVILAVCFIFPPLLLLYGYGVLDVVMLELTHGGIRRFGRGEKRFARYAGWIIGTIAIIGIVVSMIVVAATK